MSSSDSNEILNTSSSSNELEYVNVGYGSDPDQTKEEVKKNWLT